MSDIQMRIDVLRPCAGDTIVISSDRMLTDKQVDQIRRMVAPALPVGVKTLVLDPRLTLTHIVAPVYAAPSAQPLHFDTWMGQRTAAAHAEFMERTSRQLRCDWSPLARAIDTYLNRTNA